MSDTYFDVLGLPANATDVQIRDGYRKLAAEAASQPERLAKVREAYQVLANPISRRNYLQWLAAGKNENFRPDPPGQDQPAAAQTKSQAAPLRRQKTELIESENRPGAPAQAAPPAAQAKPAERKPTEYIDSGGGEAAPAPAADRPPVATRQPTEIVAPERRRQTDEVTRLNAANADSGSSGVAVWVLVTYGNTDERFGLCEGTHWIGRPSAGDPPPAVPLPDPERFVSRRHARIFIDGTTWTITDNSENGTQLNGKRLPKGKPHRLKSGDTIVIEGRKLVIRRTTEVVTTNDD